MTRIGQMFNQMCYLCLPYIHKKGEGRDGGDLKKAESSDRLL